MGFSKEERVSRGLEAKRLLEHDLFQEVLFRVRESQVETWEESDDPMIHAKCWAVRRAISEVESGLRTIINDGEVAASRSSAPSRPSQQQRG